MTARRYLLGGLAAATSLCAMAPALAQGYAKPGTAVMNCLVGRMGTTYDCMVTLQEPRALGFGTMVLRLAPYFKLKPASVAGKAVPAAVNFPFTLTESGERIR